jgi:hypothetical protein
VNSPRSARCRIATIAAVPTLTLAGLTAATGTASADTDCPQLVEILTDTNYEMQAAATAGGNTEATVLADNIIILGAVPRVLALVLAGSTCPADTAGTRQVVTAYQAEAKTLVQTASAVEGGLAMVEPAQQQLTIAVNVDAPGAHVSFAS